MNRIKFESIPGVTLEVTSNPLTILLKGDVKSLSLIKKKLTIRNKSVRFQVERLLKIINMFSYKMKYFKEDTDDYNYYKNKIKETHKQIKDLKESEITELYSEVPEGLEVPAGFWWFAENKGNSHKNTNLEAFYAPQLRDYQVQALEQLYKYKRANLCLATGLGKSLLLASICKAGENSGLRTCVVVPTDYLVGQMVDTISKFSDSVSGLGGKRKLKLGTNIVVTTAQSAMKVIDNFDIIAVDECLPYKQCILTKSGPVEIGKLYKKWKNNEKLPLVASFNEKTKQIEYKKITYAWKRKANKNLIKIKTSRLVTYCTPDHKVLTINRGWISAKDIIKTDILIGNYAKGQKQNLGARALNKHQLDIVIGSFLGDGHLSQVSNNRYRLSIIHGVKQSEYLRWKASMFRQKNIEFIKENGYSKTEAERFSSFCFDLSENLPSNKTYCPDWIINSLNERSLAIWFMDDGSVSHKNKSATFSVCSFDDESVEKLVKKLKNMNIDCKSFKCNKNYNYIRLNKIGYLNLMKLINPYIHFSMNYKSTCTSFDKKELWIDEYEKFATYPISSIKEIEYKENSKEGLGIFDLEIEDNHNFVTCGGTSRGGGIGNGIVLHNCHHSPAKTWVDIFTNTNASHVYSLTATPFRSDGQDMSIHAFTGPIVFERNARWGIENGWLKPVKIYMKTIDYVIDGKTKFLNENMNSQKAYKILSTAPNLLLEIKNTMEKMLNSGRKVIVLFKTVNACMALQKFCKGSIEFKTASSKFKKPIDDFRDGKTNVLVSNDRLISEGLDIPDANALILVTQNSSSVITSQALGRVLRKTDGFALVIDLTFNGYSSFVNAQEKRHAIYSSVSDDVFIINKEVKNA